MEWGPNFKVNKQKMTYNEIWSLALSPDGASITTARDNDCIINDVSKYKNLKAATSYPDL